jgi:hypothetical protein
MGELFSIGPCRHCHAVTERDESGLCENCRGAREFVDAKEAEYRRLMRPLYWMAVGMTLLVLAATVVAAL